MEDRYLFKAKRLDNGEWVQGALLLHDTNTVTIFNQHPADGSLQGFEVDPSTICQCTGLKDKNGKPIWENDIVNATDVNCVCVYDIVVKVTDYNLMLNLYYSDELDRVGNKFDNPELLESEG